MGLGQESDREGEVVSWEQETTLFGTFIATKVTRGLSSLSAHHLAFSVALLAQAHQDQA